MIIQQKFPWYMALVGAVGAAGLVTGIGTLAEAFIPLFGAFWAWGAAILLDLLALALTVWAIQEIRDGIPAGLVRSSAHGCIGVSVAVQAVTAAQGLSNTAGGWTSAGMHTIPPLALGLALELIYQHYAKEWRAKTAPIVAAETMREQAARAAVGVPVKISRVQRAVISAAKAGVVDMRALTRQISDDDLLQSPAVRALHAVVDPEAAAALTVRANAQKALSTRETAGFRLLPVSSTDDAPDELTTQERRERVWELTDKGKATREIARILRCSPSTVSTDQRARRKEVG